MATSRGTRFRMTSGRSQRQTLWSEGPYGHNGASSASKVAFGTAQTSSGGVTIIRIRGHYQVYCNAVAAVSDRVRWGLGIGIITSDALAVGAVAIPGPLDDIDWGGWMWHETGWVGGIAFFGPGVIQGVIDSKSMRKIKPNESVVGMLEVADEDGTVVVQASLATRMLSKLG